MQAQEDLGDVVVGKVVSDDIVSVRQLKVDDRLVVLNFANQFLKFIGLDGDDVSLKIFKRDKQERELKSLFFVKKHLALWLSSFVVGIICMLLFYSFIDSWVEALSGFVIFSLLSVLLLDSSRLGDLMGLNLNRFNSMRMVNRRYFFFLKRFNIHLENPIGHQREAVEIYVSWLRAVITAEQEKKEHLISERKIINLKKHWLSTYDEERTSELFAQFRRIGVIDEILSSFEKYFQKKDEVSLSNTLRNLEQDKDFSILLLTVSEKFGEYIREELNLTGSYKDVLRSVVDNYSAVTTKRVGDSEVKNMKSNDYLLKMLSENG